MYTMSFDLELTIWIVRSDSVKPSFDLLLSCRTGIASSTFSFAPAFFSSASPLNYSGCELRLAHDVRLRWCFISREWIEARWDFFLFFIFIKYRLSFALSCWARRRSTRQTWEALLFDLERFLLCNFMTFLNSFKFFSLALYLSFLALLFVKHSDSPVITFRGCQVLHHIVVILLLLASLCLLRFLNDRRSSERWKIVMAGHIN